LGELLTWLVSDIREKVICLGATSCKSSKRMIKCPEAKGLTIFFLASHLIPSPLGPLGGIPT
jgi:hypothetical protein